MYRVQSMAQEIVFHLLAFQGVIYKCGTSCYFQRHSKKVEKKKQQSSDIVLLYTVVGTNSRLFNSIIS